MQHMQLSAMRRPRNAVNPVNTAYENSCLHELGGSIHVDELCTAHVSDARNYPSSQYTAISFQPR